MTVNEICEYITKLKYDSKKAGKTKIILTSGELHKDLDLKDRMPSVCSAMYHCMHHKDTILHTTPSGFSSTIRIEYNL